MSAETIQDASIVLKKALIERNWGAELGTTGAERPEESSSQRNGKSGKTVLTDDIPLPLDILRDPVLEESAQAKSSQFFSADL